MDLNLSKTYAVLIGASNFKGLPQLPAAKRNVERLKSLLADPDVVGVPEDNIKVVKDPPNAEALAIAIAETADRASDTLIVYYAGHGLIHPHTHKYYLAASTTTQEYMQHNGVDFSEVEDAIKGSRAGRRILILDCCYSGRAISSMGVEQP